MRERERVREREREREEILNRVDRQFFRLMNFSAPW